MTMPDINLNTDNIDLGRDIPLMEFEARLAKYDYEAGEENRVYINFHFDELQVHQSESTWSFPTVTLRLRYNPGEGGKLSNRSPLGSFLSSLGNHGVGHPDAAVGLKMYIKAEKQTIENNGEVTGRFKTWIVDHLIEDVQVDPEELLLDTIDGKSQTEIIRAVSSNASLRQYNNDAIEGTLLTRLVEEKKITANEDGTYSKA